MKFSNAEILEAIIASKVLDKYLDQNPLLIVMINNSKNSNIHYGKEFIPTMYQIEIMDRRIKIKDIKDADDLSKVNAYALEKVKAFTDEYPKNYIFDVVFNLTDKHFTIWCGLMDTGIEVLCIMQGDHIPDYVFGEEK